MKKSILATLLAGLFTIGAAFADEPRIIKFEIEKEDNQPTMISLDSDGENYKFEFTDEELKDEDLLNNRLAALDDKTREEVLGVLKGIHMDGANMIFIKDDIVGDDEDKKIVIIKQFIGSGHEGEHEVIIDVDNAGAHQLMTHGGKHFVVKFDDNDNTLGHDTGHAAKVIEKLLQHGQFDAQQLQTIQNALDAKR